MSPGAHWPLEAVLEHKGWVEDAGFTLDVIESINVPEAVKLGLPERDQQIETYAENIRTLGRAGVRVLCYNFMPVFDWIRSEMIATLPDTAAPLYP